MLKKKIVFIFIFVSLISFSKNLLAQFRVPTSVAYTALLSSCLFNGFNLLDDAGYIPDSINPNLSIETRNKLENTFALLSLTNVYSITNSILYTSATALGSMLSLSVVRSGLQSFWNGPEYEFERIFQKSIQIYNFLIQGFILLNSGYHFYLNSFPFKSSATCAETQQITAQKYLSYINRLNPKLLHECLTYCGFFELLNKQSVSKAFRNAILNVQKQTELNFKQVLLTGNINSKEYLIESILHFLEKKRVFKSIRIRNQLKPKIRYLQNTGSSPIQKSKVGKIVRSHSLVSYPIPNSLDVLLSLYKWNEVIDHTDQTNYIFIRSYSAILTKAEQSENEQILFRLYILPHKLVFDNNQLDHGLLQYITHVYKRAHYDNSHRFFSAYTDMLEIHNGDFSIEPFLNLKKKNELHERFNNQEAYSNYYIYLESTEAVKVITAWVRLISLGYFDNFFGNEKPTSWLDYPEGVKLMNDPKVTLPW